MAGENANANASGAGPEGNAAPKLVEVEIDGKKIQVSEEGKEFLMKEKDYRQKTQSLAEERRTLEKEREGLKTELDSARGLMGFLSNDPKAYGVVTALLSGDQAQARKLLEDQGEGGELETIKRQVAELQLQLKSKEARDVDSAKKTQQYADAKRRLDAEYGLNLDKLYPQMVERGMKDGNPYIPWALSVGLEELKKKAVDDAKLTAKQEALEELRLKLDNTPPISSGAGTNGKGGKKTQTDAIISAFNRLREEKIRGGAT